MDKIFIFLLCAILQFYIYPIDNFTIAITLIAVIICSLNTLVLNGEFLSSFKHQCVDVIFSAYLIISLFVPPLIHFVPVLTYDIFYYRHKLSFLSLPICLIGNFFVSQTTYAILFTSLCLFSILLQYKEKNCNQLSQDLKNLRDSNKENELLIKNKNRALQENQDAMIYMATLKERNRIAREIHDNVGHMLTRSILQVGALKAIANDDLIHEPLEQLHNTLNTAMNSIRSSVHDLHDESIDLESSINEMTNSLDNFNVNFEYDMSDYIPRNIKYSFISIVKEAISNVIKHSNGDTLDITLREHPGFYQLTIEDNGTNINLDVNEGIGLSNIRERTQSLNGNIVISTDNGFKILISIIKEME